MLILTRKCRIRKQYTEPRVCSATSPARPSGRQSDIRRCSYDGTDMQVGSNDVYRNAILTTRTMLLTSGDTDIVFNASCRKLHLDSLATQLIPEPVTVHDPYSIPSIYHTRNVFSYDPSQSYSPMYFQYFQWLPSKRSNFCLHLLFPPFEVLVQPAKTSYFSTLRIVDYLYKSKS
jgi:hypothetical protein